MKDKVARPVKWEKLGQRHRWWRIYPARFFIKIGMLIGGEDIWYDLDEAFETTKLVKKGNQHGRRK